MKYFLIPCFLFLISYSLSAHPGIGIVKDSKGNIYYTDLEQVWKLSAEGKKTIAVHGVHTHELYMDENNDLYGEHMWYNGERLNTWGHYVWCLRHNGKLDTIIRPSAGFRTDYSFVRDRLGNMYWVERATVTKFKKKAKDGTITTIAEGRFRDVRWMCATENGMIYFADLTDVYKLENGKFTLLAEALHEKASLLEFTSLQHNVYGLWPDKNENIYVAILGGQVVKKITADGTVSNIVYSTGTWRPCGGLFDDNGNLWLMEIDGKNEVRVRKVAFSNFKKSISPMSNFSGKEIPVMIFAGVITLILASVVLFRRSFLLKKDNKSLPL